MTSGVRRALLFFETARHLRPHQFLGRLRRLVRPAAAHRTIDTSWSDERAAKALAALDALGPVDETHAVRNRALALRDGQLLMLGIRRPAPETWREPTPNPLWAYHLHYHDMLAEAAWAAREFRDIELRRKVGASLDGWLLSWGNGGSPAWDPYPISVRVINWMRILATRVLTEAQAKTLKSSLATQIDVLDRSLEWDLDANHLMRNAWALSIAPLCFSGPWADRIVRRGTSLFWKCVASQTPDGLQEERSPMYHARALRDALELEAVHRSVGIEIPPEGSRKIAAMQATLGRVRHPDGALRLVNDSAGDHCVDLTRLTTPTAREHFLPSDGVWVAPRARFVSVRDVASGDEIFIDVGAPGPPHQPAHGHAGALGFELDLGGVAFIADTGCSGYDGDPWRPYLRGTAAHSTIAINGMDQSELWGSFRLARRATVKTIRVSGDANDFEMTASCSPYHMPRASHVRTIRRSGREVIVEDVVMGALGASIEGFVHFADGWSAERLGESEVQLRNGTATARVHIDGPKQWSLHYGERSPVCGWRALGFNRVVPCWALRSLSTGYDGSRWRLTIRPEP